MSTVIGLDIGGSKTHAVCAVGDQLVAEAQGGSANTASVGAEEAGHQLDLVLTSLGHRAVDAVCAGSAGVDTPEAAERLRRLLADRVPGAAVRVVHDTELILAAAGLETGIAVISGTGSVAWGRTAEGRTARAGGWGHLLGDEGGGYGIAREAVRHTLRQADRGLPPDRLSVVFLAACGVATAPQLLEHFYLRPDRRYWADHAGLVFALAADGEPVAAQLVAAAADALADLIQTAATVLRARLPVVLGGGLVVHQPLLQEAVRTRLSPLELDDVRVLDADPVQGALALARGADPDAPRGLRNVTETRRGTRC